MLHDFIPVMKQAQELMRQFDSVRPFIEAARRNDQLMRQAAEALAFTGPVFELANNFMAASEAVKDALRVDSSTLNIGKTLPEQLDIASAMRSALPIRKTSLDAWRTARFTSDAIQSTMHIDTSALNIATRALSRQAETAAAMKAALQIDTSALEWAKTVVPQFDTVRPLVTALQRAVPELPKLEISSVVQEAVRSLSAMNMTPQLAAALGPPAGLTNLMRSVSLNASIDMPSLVQAQQAATSTASSLRLSELRPDRFGIVLTEGEGDAALRRLIAKARTIAQKDDAKPEDAIELATEADAVTMAASQEAKGRVAVFLNALLLALIVDLLKDGIIEGSRVLLPYLVALPLSFQPTPPPALPPAPAPFTVPASPDELGVPRVWGIEGLPQIIRRAGRQAERRTLEFFETGISNRNTRQAYAHAVVRFMNWCEDRNLELADISTFTVSAYVSEMSREYSARSVHQHLSAIRGLFDHLVAGNVVSLNPASLVRGPQDDGTETRRKTTTVRPQEIRRLLDSIETEDCSGLRDRGLIATIAYGFARVSAAVAMDVKDYFERDCRGWLRLRDRTGTYEIPLHPKAKTYLDAYIAEAGISGELDAALWRTMTKERRLGGDRMSRVDVFRMVKRRVSHAGLPLAVNCEGVRAAGIAAYLAGGGTLERASVQVQLSGRIAPTDVDRFEI